MTTYYVSTNGSNSNSGMISSPWRDIGFAIATMNEGDTVYVRGGTYGEADLGPRSHQVIAGYPGERPIVTPAVQSSVIFGIGPDTDGAQISNLVLVGGALLDVGANHAPVIGIAGTNTLLQDLDISNPDGGPSGHNGIVASNGTPGYADGTVVSRCYIHNCESLQWLGTLGIYNAGGNDFLVQDCHFDNIGFQSKKGGAVRFGPNNPELNCRDNLMQRCLVTNCTGGVLYYHRVHGHRVFNNVFVGIRGGDNLGVAISGWGVDCGYGVNPDPSDCFAEWYNNTIVNSDAAFSVWHAINITAKNNIAWKCNVFLDRSQDDDAWYLQNFGAQSLPQFSFNMENMPDPKFVNELTGDYHLMPDSPAIGAGLDLTGTVAYDYDGRIRSAPYDIGAFQYGAPPNGGGGPGPTTPPPPANLKAWIVPAFLLGAALFLPKVRV